MQIWISGFLLNPNYDACDTYVGVTPTCKGGRGDPDTFLFHDISGTLKDISHVFRYIILSSKNIHRINVREQAISSRIIEFKKSSQTVGITPRVGQPRHWGANDDYILELICRLKGGAVAPFAPPYCTGLTSDMAVFGRLKVVENMQP